MMCQTPVQTPREANGIALLDNPIWNALSGEHGHLALVRESARRYPPEIGPLAGIRDQSEPSYADLRTLTGPGGVVALFHQQAQQARHGWTALREALMCQMVCDAGPQPDERLLPAEVELRPLTAVDAPAMVALAALTEPGPFEPRTVELGSFFGIFRGEQLVAMAGQRTRVPGFIEVSAVCTHPSARGRGYARTLIGRVNEDIFRQDRIPYLHSLAANASAIAVYHSLGFRFRRELHLAILRSDG
jgi:predicted GNAT family acetyltransferase